MLKNWRVRLFLLPVFILTAARVADAGPIGYSVRAHQGGELYAIDLSNGLATLIGDISPAAGDDLEGLAFIGSTLYGVTGGVVGSGFSELWNITTPPGVKVQNAPRFPNDAGLDFDPVSGVLYAIAGGNHTQLYSVILGDVTPNAIGNGAVINNGQYADGLAINAAGTAFAVGGVAGTGGQLYSVNLTTGDLTTIGGSMGVTGPPQGQVPSQVFHAGLAFDPTTGTLWMTDDLGRIHTINTTTGAATFVANITAAPGTPVFGGAGFEGLAIGPGGGLIGTAEVPEPATLSLFGLGLAALAYRLRRRTSK